MDFGKLSSRAEAAYLGLALGDALGATVEFQTPREIRAQFGVHREIRGGGWLRLRPGHVTDDTTMSLALGACILEQHGKVDALACAQALDAWMRGKPVDIGNTVRRNLIRFRHSGHPEAPPSEHDAGNGAAMRALPVALVTLGGDASCICHAVQAQAHVTHNNPLSDAACEFLTLAVHAALRGATLRTLYRQRIAPFVQAWPQFNWRGKRRENPSGYIVDTMQTVLQALMETGGFEDCLVETVNRGGDADTTGAIAGMLAGALYGIEGIPQRWLKNLEAKVRVDCIAQARALLSFSQAATD